MWPARSPSREAHPGANRIVQREPWQTTYDRELDLQPRPPSQASGESIEAYQRLIANPFLFVLGCVLVFALVRGALQVKSVTMFFTGLGLLGAAILLLQFHCLDCGATGWLLGSRRHA